MRHFFGWLLALIAGVWINVGTANAAPLTEGWQNVEGIHVFYREGGDPSAPAIVFLHGTPLSSFMYVKVMEDLLRMQHGHVHVIAIDYPGFGYSEAPDHRSWPYTFDHIAATVRDLLRLRGIRRYSLYMQDYGAPVGFRLIADEPSAVTAIIVQNGVIHIDGFPMAQDPHSAIRRYWYHRDLAVDAAQIDATKKLTEPNATWTDNDNIGADASLLMSESLQRPGVAEARNDLWFDYGSNLARYPSWQATLRKMDIPVLVLWGNQDKFFTTPGAKAYLRESPHAEIHILDAGHFATLQVPDEIASLISAFVDRHSSAFIE
ncbi:alpha/beta hydrolase [Dyella sp. S184]|uniref:alpha/beta fold hydrolase n=1 Tax=Dyella sp. S184 TaxID=1641862 RepID=UPI00131BE37D|nr:alpha/beta hydrolase [Dyella sp. S184]